MRCKLRQRKVQSLSHVPGDLFCLSLSSKILWLGLFVSIHIKCYLYGRNTKQGSDEDPTGTEFRTGTGTGTVITSATRYRNRYQALSPVPVRLCHRFVEQVPGYVTGTQTGTRLCHRNRCQSLLNESMTIIFALLLP